MRRCRSSPRPASTRVRRAATEAANSSTSKIRWLKRFSKASCCEEAVRSMRATHPAVREGGFAARPELDGGKVARGLGHSALTPFSADGKVRMLRTHADQGYAIEIVWADDLQDSADAMACCAHGRPSRVSSPTTAKRLTARWSRAARLALLDVACRSSTGRPLSQRFAAPTGAGRACRRGQRMRRGEPVRRAQGRFSMTTW